MSCQQQSTDRSAPQQSEVQVPAPKKANLSSEQVQVLKQIEIECSISPYFVAITDLNEIMIDVPPNFRAKPLSREQIDCVHKHIDEKLNIEVAR